MSAHIRPGKPDDLEPLYRICRLTADAGQDATSKYSIGNMPGNIWAAPYGVSEMLDAGKAFVFILEDDAEPHGEVGYIVGTADTRAFDVAQEQSWWPPLRAKYPAVQENDERTELTESDKYCLKNIYTPNITVQEIIDFSPAHIHINVLPSHQRRGYGKKLIQTAAKHLREQHGLDALWLGIDPRNNEARKFYLKIGFEKLEAPEGEYYGLRFDKIL